MERRGHVGWVSVLLQDAVASIYCYVLGMKMYSDIKSPVFGESLPIVVLFLTSRFCPANS